MKYMLIMRATDEAYAAMADVDMTEMIDLMGRFNDELIRAGVLLAAEGLEDASEGVVVDHSSEPPVVTDGPYGETKELFGGFYLLNVSSKEEAVEWAKRLPQRRVEADRAQDLAAERAQRPEGVVVAGRHREHAGNYVE